MPGINLNPENEYDFELLFSIKKDTLDALIDKLKNSEPGLSPRKISEQFHEILKIHPDELERIIRLIYSVNQIKLSSGLDAEKVKDDLLEALQQFDNETLKLEHCADYLSSVLNIDGAIVLTVLARDLAYASERILLDTDIETDIKPIFYNDKLKGLVIVHTLKIDFMENGQGGNTTYLALDKDDMDKLEKLIQRAKSRESSLKADISSTFVDFA